MPNKPGSPCMPPPVYLGQNYTTGLSVPNSRIGVRKADRTIWRLAKAFTSSIVYRQFEVISVGELGSLTMSGCHLPDFMCGWVSGPNTRGTIDIIYSCLSTIWLCTWTCLCLNIPDRHESGWRFLVYKFRWQAFAIFFPEVLVASAAEQWMSARQSVTAFNALGFDHWSVRHGFFADMGGIMIAPRDGDCFPVNSCQLAYLVRHAYISLPQLEMDDIRAVNKADGLARAFTLGQVIWFTLSCLGRATNDISLTPLELETLAFILCTIHTFFFWYHKPLDPSRSIVVPLELNLSQLGVLNLDLNTYKRTPLEVIDPLPDPKSLVTPFWFGFRCVIEPFERASSGPRRPHLTVPNSIANPPDGIGWMLTLYIIFFQITYYGLHIGVGWLLPFPTTVEFYLWEGAGIVNAGLIAIYVIGLSLGSHFAPWIGKNIFHRDASTVLEVANMLPLWAKFFIHAPFVFTYLLARIVGLASTFSSLRALPVVAFQAVSWSNFLPHI
ncbi:hypothetical protein F4777DRAFT_572332 [Nemania sp. FL0916]|nr:hypothetical protein F4777DRAFT_572332 [Nemania sp. FL0916]